MRKFEVKPIGSKEAPLTVEAEEFDVTGGGGEYPIHEARFYREERLTTTLKRRALVHYVRHPEYVTEISEPAPAVEVIPPARQSYDLPPVFWEYIARGNMKIHAIKELRQATGMSLKSAKDVVDALWRNRQARLPGTPRVAEVYSVMLLADLPKGTVIRVKGQVTHDRYTGYVFEKTDVNTWITTGDEDDYRDGDFTNWNCPDGWDVLYVPQGV